MSKGCGAPLGYTGSVQSRRSQLGKENVTPLEPLRATLMESRAVEMLWHRSDHSLLQEWLLFLQNEAEVVISLQGEFLKSPKKMFSLLPQLHSAV